jgi:hypothetical protein
MTVLLNKEAAAHRLIVAAVEMCERGDEPLAIHVVASSAFGILRELIAKRGTNYGTQAFKAMLFYAATQKQKGVDVFNVQDDELDDAVDLVIQMIESGKISHPNHIQYEMPKHIEFGLSKFIRDPFNFLKHADRDGDSHLPEGDVEPILATMSAISAFAILFPERPVPPQLQAFLTKHRVSLERQ